jgi:hypothetical protein
MRQVSAAARSVATCSSLSVACATTSTSTAVMRPCPSVAPRRASSAPRSH